MKTNILYCYLFTAPTGIAAPKNVTATTERQLFVEWEEPTGYTGPLIGYEINAYNSANMSIAPFVANFSEVTYTGNIIISPYIEYSFVEYIMNIVSISRVVNQVVYGIIITFTCMNE